MITVGIFFVGVLSLFAQVSFSQEYIYQNGLDGYDEAHDVTIYSGDMNECRGTELSLTFEQCGLLKFGSIQVPSGLYRMRLMLYVEDFMLDDVVHVYPLLKTGWSDPEQFLNPPLPSSTNPTWGYHRYSSEAWEQPGATGVTDRGPLLASQYVDEATSYTWEAEIEVEPGQNALGFLLTSDGEITFSDKAGGLVQEQKPKLTLTLMKRYGYPAGLDQNPYFERRRPLRFVPEWLSAGLRGLIPYRMGINLQPLKGIGS